MIRVPIPNKLQKNDKKKEKENHIRTLYRGIFHYSHFYLVFVHMLDIQ